MSSPFVKKALVFNSITGSKLYLVDSISKVKYLSNLNNNRKNKNEVREIFAYRKMGLLW